MNSMKASLVEANRKKSSKNVSSQKPKSSNRNTNFDDVDSNDLLESPLSNDKLHFIIYL